MFHPPTDLGVDRRAQLADAIRRWVAPGQSLYFAVGHSRPHAAMYELCRQFRGRDPRFEMAVLGASHAFILPIHLGLVRRLVTTFAGDTYPTPSPSPVINRAWKGGMEIESWSVLSYVERLRAAARGAEWALTGSLRGSSLLESHLAAGRARISDGEVLIRAFAPDLTFVHAACADRAGNLVLTPPWGDGIAGMLAAKSGVIATVERIVSTEEVRKLQHLVRVPRDAVLAVCEVPFGAHPAGLWAHPSSAPGVSPYAEDYPFMAEVRQAARSDLDAWFERRIAKGHEAYLQSIDLDELRRRALEPVAAGVTPVSATPTPAERAIVETARHLRQRCSSAGHRTLLAGIGAANLAAWLAVRQLTEAGHEVDLMAELGLYGYWPQPGEPFVFHFANLPTCLSLTEIDEVMGLHLRRGMAVVGAAQIDAAGNVNTTEIPGERYLLGSGGHNDCASLSAEVMVLCGAEPGRLVEKVAYVTSPGERIRTLATERGLFEKVDGRFRLRSAPDPVADSVAYLRAHAFRFDTFPEITAWADPLASELELLSAWDPQGYFRR